MLSFFRRMVRHPLGAAVALGFVALLGLAFVLTDKADLSGTGQSIAKGDVVATVGKTAISVAELEAAVQRDFNQIRQQQPSVTMEQYVAGGGVDGSLERLIDANAVQRFSADQGIVIGKQAVDAVIASEPGLTGLDGKFDQKRYEAVLRENGVTDAKVRKDIAVQAQTRYLMLRTVSAKQVPTALAQPYADLLLEKRSGTIGIIPSAAMPAGAPPTDPQITAFYARNASRYRVPERRSVRYAILNAATVAAEATPRDSDIAAAYKAQAATFAAADLRTITQVVVGDQAAASALAAKVRAGTAIDQAARAAGLEPSTLTDQAKAAYAAQTAPAVADAAFAAKVGDVVGPVRAPLGFIVLKIVQQRTQPAKSLAEATPALKATLLTQRTATLLTDKRNAFEDQLAKASFDSLVAQQKLTALRTAALLPGGQDIDAPAAKPDPALAPILAAAFAAQAGDGPQTVPLGQDGSFALVVLDKIVPAAPRPLPLIRDIVMRDLITEQRKRAARVVAAQVVARANGGTPLAQALAATGLKLPPVSPVNAPRAALMANPNGVPAPLSLLFTMPAKATKLLEAPNDGGWIIIHLDAIQPGDARGNARVIEGTRGDIAGAIGREYASAFAKAIQRAVGTTRNAAAIAKVKADLLGGARATTQP